MASRRSVLAASMESLPNSTDPLRDLFEACKTGDIARVRKLVTPQTVNARDTAGRKSTPLHFAAGMIGCFRFLLLTNSYVYRLLSIVLALVSLL